MDTPNGTPLLVRCGRPSGTPALLRATALDFLSPGLDEPGGLQVTFDMHKTFESR